MQAAPEFPLEVLYDGSCSVCSRGAAVYEGKCHEGRLRFVDIAASDFNPERYGIPLEQLMHEIHAIDRNGRIFRSVDAFWAIWQALPPSSFHTFLGLLITTPGSRFLAHRFYQSFARMRRYLPKTGGCGNNSCRIGRKVSRTR